jgi:hypothetical protein|tara:strand:+ start:2274 stop:2513 length:240 start_codon:yes stop_codon:yes gene_type:complete
MKGTEFLGFSNTAMEIFAPVKSVIIDMIMVQLLAIIVTLGLVLLTGGDTLDSDTMAYLVAGLFGAFFMLGGIYSRISEI